MCQMECERLAALRVFYRDLDRGLSQAVEDLVKYFSQVGVSIGSLGVGSDSRGKATQRHAVRWELLPRTG